MKRSLIPGDKVYILDYGLEITIVGPLEIAERDSNCSCTTVYKGNPGCFRLHGWAWLVGEDHCYPSIEEATTELNERVALREKLRKLDIGSQEVTS